MKHKPVVFKDYPQFTPNLTPREIFLYGSFGGTYWRPISSTITNNSYKNIHKKFPSSYWKDIPDKFLMNDWNKYDKEINKYKVKVGSDLQTWEENGWITKYHPYGWVHWYCDFYSGRRGKDDLRQINRWLNFAGPNGRFRKRLINLVKEKNKKYDDFTISPAIRQSLQHWGYILVKNDIN